MQGIPSTSIERGIIGIYSNNCSERISSYIDNGRTYPKGVWEKSCRSDSIYENPNEKPGKKTQPSPSSNIYCVDSFNTIISTTWMWIDKISDLNCIIIPERPSTIQTSIYFSQKYGLLAKDAYIAAFAETYGIPHIATNDIDFNVIPMLTSWIPETTQNHK